MYVPTSKKEIIKRIQRYEKCFYNRNYTIKEIKKERSRTELVGWLSKFN